MPKDVSIIIPTKDRLWSLPQTIQSCSDSRNSVEIIVVDDGSTDGTWEWLQGQAHIKKIQGSGWGKPWGVNRAFRQSCGRYIRFLDSDDWLPNGVIGDQIELADSSGADLVVAGYELYKDDRLERYQPWINCDDFVAQQLGECDSSHYSAFLFRRSLIEEIPHRTLFPAADFASRDDRCFMLEVALAEPDVAVFEGPGLCHRHHERGRLQFSRGIRQTGTHLQHLLIYKNILTLLQNDGRLTERRRKAVGPSLWRLAHWLGYDDPDVAADVAAWVFELDHEFKPPETGLLGLMYTKLGFRTTERILRLRRKLVRRRTSGRDKSTIVFPA